jgi:hypothetical protein
MLGLPPSIRRLTQRGALAPALFAALLFTAACSGGGGGDAAVGGDAGGAVQTTGSVGILFTDGPVDPDDFQHIFLTITEILLIGDEGQVSIFQGRQVIDLRDVEDVARLLIVGRKVPARSFSKIRLLVDEIELVPTGGGPSIFPELPPKIDLNPREEIRVRPGKLLLVQLDVDCGKSLLIVEKGNGGVKFRPVIFVEIVSVPKPGKPVLLQGTIEEIDPAAETFLLCDTHFVSRPGSGGRVTFSERRHGNRGRGRGGDHDDRGDDDHGDDDDDDGDDDDDDGDDDDEGEADDDGEDDDDDERKDFCVQIAPDDETSYFDANGDPADFDALLVGDTASVLGRFEHFDDHEDLVFTPLIVQLGEDTLALDGIATTEVNGNDRFRIELDPGQGIVTDDGTLLVELQEGSKVFRRSGGELDPEDIAVDDPVRASGILALSSSSDDLLKAAFVVVDVEALETERLEGEIVAVMSGGGRIDVETDDGVECVNVPAAAGIFRVMISQDGGSADAIERSDLMVGDLVSIFGESNSCFNAATVLVFEEQVNPLAIVGGAPSASASREAEEEEAAARVHLSVQRAPAGGFGVFEAGPRRTEAGLVWGKLPEDAPEP